MLSFLKVTLALLLHTASGLAPDYTADRVTASQEVREGVPPQTLEELATYPNIERIMRVFPSASWTELFPASNKDSGPDGTPYNYHNFVAGAWKYPRFCGETGQSDAECLHEIVVMFSHFIQETGGKRGPADGLEDGLYWMREIDCYNPANPHQVGSCGKIYCENEGIWGQVYPCGDRAYYGRGAKQLSWNYNYASFSKKMTGSADTYLVEPDRIITDGWPALASAIWFWMTPQMPKPSMHEVVTGLWAPNSADTGANIIASFGTTTNIINGAQECSKGTEDERSVARMGYYRNLCGRFNAECFQTADTCGSMGQFSEQGTGGQGPLQYLDQRWDGVEGCKPVAYQMPFVVGLDEEACRCHFFPNNADCQGAPASPTAAPPAATTAAPVTTAAPTTTAAADANCASTWQQCGGEGHADMCCEAGSQCYRSTQWYSQCRASCPAGWECNDAIDATTAAPATTAAAATTTAAAADVNCASTWQQCGGEGHPDLCCEAGSECQEDSKWYSQCRPARRGRRLRGSA